MRHAVTEPATILGCITCYVLNDRTRVVTVESVLKFLTGRRESGGWKKLVALIPEGFSAQPHRIEFLDKKRMRIVGLNALGLSDLIQHCAAEHPDLEIADRCATALGIAVSRGQRALIEEATTPVS